MIADLEPLTVLDYIPCSVNMLIEQGLGLEDIATRIPRQSLLGFN